MESGLTSGWASRASTPSSPTGRPAWAAARAWLAELLTDEVHRDGVEPHLVPLDDVTMHLPIEVADYVDFYASEHHATNVGPHLPPRRRAAARRTGSTCPSATTAAPAPSSCRAPTSCARSGQRKAADRPGADLRAERRASTSRPSWASSSAAPPRLGDPVRVGEAAEHLFGVVLLNDWSARDIQAWEYVPLGPVPRQVLRARRSRAWVTPLDALAAARVPLPGQDPRAAALPARATPTRLFGLDLHLEVRVNGTVVARPEYRDMYWSPAQMLAHLTVNGASLRNGDLFASGHDLAAPRSGHPRQLARAVVERHRADHPRRRHRRAASSRTATRSTIRAWAPGAGRRAHRPRRGHRRDRPGCGLEAVGWTRTAGRAVSRGPR